MTVQEAALCARKTLDRVEIPLGTIATSKLVLFVYACEQRQQMPGPLAQRVEIAAIKIYQRFRALSYLKGSTRQTEHGRQVRAD
jgi:hypothetical protein